MKTNKLIKTVFVAYIIATSLFNQSMHAQINNLAKTPPMGWSSWNSFRGTTNDQLYKQMADIMVSSGMKDAGYEYVNMDVGWWTNLGPNNNGRDSVGNIIPNWDIKALANYVHGKGLKIGIYTDFGPTGCSTPFGSYGHYEKDTKQFAKWEMDYVKVDACGRANLPQGLTDRSHKFFYGQFRDALLKCGRPIVYSICDWGMEKPTEWGPKTGNLWRVGSDIDCWDDILWLVRWEGVLHEIDEVSKHADIAGPGRWNDPDMLVVGVNNVLSYDENVAHFSMWCILTAPLIAGNDLRDMTPEILSILTNKEAIAVNQDANGIQGKLVSKHGDYEVYMKPLSDGGKAVVLFNRSAKEANIAANWSEIGVSGTKQVRDLWLHKDLGGFNYSFSANVPSHGVVMIKVK